MEEHPVDHQVQVKFEYIDDRYYVTVDKYPIPGGKESLKNWDTVTWTADETVELEVGFELAYKLETLKPEPPQRTYPTGPFESLSHPEGKKNVVVGKLSRDGDDLTVRWRYLCIFFRDGKWAPWKLDSTSASEGGVDTHRPPPIQAQAPGEGPAREV